MFIMCICIPIGVLIYICVGRYVCSKHSPSIMHIPLKKHLKINQCANSVYVIKGIHGDTRNYPPLPFNG